MAVYRGSAAAKKASARCAATPGREIRHTWNRQKAGQQPAFSHAQATRLRRAPTAAATRAAPTSAKLVGSGTAPMLAKPL